MPTDKELVAVVIAHLETKCDDPFSLEGPFEVAADLLIAAAARGIIGNGGHVYWYEGMDGAQTVRAADAFRRMGLDVAAAALLESLSAFPGGAPPSDLAARQTYVNEHRARLNERLESLDKVVWDIDLDAAAAAYISKRRADLLRGHPELAECLVLH